MATTIKSNFVCFHSKMIVEEFGDSQNSSLDFKQYILACHKMSKWTIEKRLSWIFGIFDINQSNSLELVELVKLFSTIFILEGVDKDKAVDKAVKSFGYMDINRNGEVSKNEFIKTCLSDKALVDHLCQNNW